MSEKIKFCPACNQSKPFDSFHKNSKRKDGLQSQCKECHSLIRGKGLTNEKNDSQVSQKPVSQTRLVNSQKTHTVTDVSQIVNVDISNQLAPILNEIKSLKETNDILFQVIEDKTKAIETLENKVKELKSDIIELEIWAETALNRLAKPLNKIKPPKENKMADPLDWDEAKETEYE